MQVDLLLADLQRLARAAVRQLKCLHFCTQNLRVKPRGFRNVGDSQYQMIQSSDFWCHYQLFLVRALLNLGLMQNDPPPPIRQTDLLDPARAAAFQAALGDPVTITTGAPLPPFFHQLYFWTPHAPDQLGRDGHPRVGGFIPDMDLPRRMWAGGRLEFHHHLLAGEPAIQTSTLQSAARKDGRSGPLAFVTLRHEIHQSGRLCLTEWRDLVYREDPKSDTPKPVAPIAPPDETRSREVVFNSTLLFRYSALTFNGHRIHYDLDYARNVEGYDGLVVHGPLLAQHLMLLAQEHLGPLKTFAFRATAPLMHFETANLCWRNQEFWVRAPDGRQCMAATATAA